MFKDYYKVLEISNQSTESDIKSAYRRLSKRWHPDKNIDTNTISIMQDINEAYSILNDRIKRTRYDEEYKRFKQQFFDIDIIVSPRSSKTWSYNYDVQDENLKDDIRGARIYSQKLVADFINSLKEASQVAAKGAWSSAKGYVYSAIILAIIGGVVQISLKDQYKIQDENYTAMADVYIKEPVADTTLQITNTAAKVLEAFQTPNSWTRYIIGRDALSISLPSSVELRNEYDKYTMFAKATGIPINTDVVVFQQKGLSSSEATKIDGHYCRIMIQHIAGEYNDFLHSNEVETLNHETISFFRDIVISELAPFALLEEPEYSWIDIEGIKAIEIKYRRDGNNDHTTACAMYLLFNSDEMAKIVVSYREQESDLWLPDINNIIKTFLWE